MIVRLSTGLRNSLATHSGLGALMAEGWMGLYDTALPDSPDEPAEASPIARITQEGKAFIPPDDPLKAGLQVLFSPPGGLTRYGTWVLTGLANGTARWFRWWWKEPDNGLLSTYYPRIDGDVGDLQSDAALRLATTRIAPGHSRALEQVSIWLPAGVG